jgi:hypothetical protein
MTIRASLVTLVFCAFFTSGCCKACSAVSGIAKEIAGPEAADGERLVKERVANDKELRKQICGVETKELVNLVIKKDPLGSYSIQGNPIERPTATSASAKPVPSVSAKPIVDAKKAVECVAVVRILWDAKESPGGTTWSIQRLDIDEISTPGIEFKAPSSDWD